MPSGSPKVQRKRGTCKTQNKSLSQGALEEDVHQGLLAAGGTDEQVKLHLIAGQSQGGAQTCAKGPAKQGRQNWDWSSKGSSFVPVKLPAFADPPFHTLTDCA